MADKDITLGEVYRAVLSLKDEFVETRKEITVAHDVLREEQKVISLKLKESEVKIRVLEDGKKSLEDRVLSLEKAETPSSNDNLARASAGIGSGLALLASWWLSRGGN